MINVELHLKNEDDQYDFTSISSSNAFRDAEANNLEIKLPFPDQLFTDIDSKEGAEAYSRNITKFKNHIAKVVDDSFTQSKSKGEYNYHYILFLAKEITPLERILYQLFLGSDRTREMLSYIRLINGDPNPTLFFEKKPDMLTAGDKPLALLAKNCGPTEYAGDNS